MLKGLTLLCALLWAAWIPGKSRIYVKIPYNSYGRLLKAELTRDWTVTAGGKKPELAKYNAMRDRVLLRIVIVEDPWLRCPKCLPQWSISKYGPWYEYDMQALSISTYPLRYTNYLIKKLDWNEEHHRWILQHSTPGVICPKCQSSFYSAGTMGDLCPEPKCPEPPWIEDALARKRKQEKNGPGVESALSAPVSPGACPDGLCPRN